MPLPKIADELKAELALARFNPLKLGMPPLRYPDLALQFAIELGQGGVTEKTLQKAIQDAFRLGLVTVVRNEGYQPRRNRALEGILAQTFPDLDDVVVIKLSPRTNTAQVHEHLGKALAELINNTKSRFRDGDKICIGNGRGVYFTADALTKYPSIVRTNIEIRSMAGQMFPEATSDTVQLLLDADNNTRRLAQYFNGSFVHTRRVSTAIAFEPLRAKKIIEETWWGKSEENSLADFALVGVGVIYQDHSLYQQAVRPLNAGSSIEPIHSFLDRVAKISDEVHAKHHYYPVYDLAARLYFIEPPKGVTQNERDDIRGRIQALLDEINRRTVTLEPDHLRKMNNIMVIGGTAVKGRALYSVLRNNRLRVRVLCTDEAAALEMLSCERERG